MLGVVAWLKGLSAIGKIGLVSAAGIGLVTFTNASAEDVITTKTETVTVSVPYATTYQDDDNLFTTDTKVVKPGIEGSKEITYKVTYSNGVEKDRDITGQKIRKEAIAEIAARGTRELKKVDVTEVIPFESKTVADASMLKGTSQVTTAGANGSKVVTYEVISLRGQELSRKALAESVATEPVTQITSVGSKVVSNCDQNYSGCVPIASDVDCGSGSGNGPAYVYSTVRVIGSDIYGLDRDGDGYGCD